MLLEIGGRGAERARAISACGAGRGASGGGSDRGAAASAYSTVTLFARFRGWSTSVPFSTATW
jgi:hypothetical protein